MIDRTGDLVTLINTFTVTPENQPIFLETQHGEYRRLKGQIRGAMGANLHRGRSGRRAVNYAQFRSLEELGAWQASDLMKDHLPVIQPYLERVAPALFRVVHVAEHGEGAARIAEGTEAVIAVMSVDPDALEDVLASQRDAAEHLVRAVPGTQAIAIHRGLPRPQPGGGPGAATAAGTPRAAQVALYAVVEREQDARALMDDARYRAAFTTENPHIREVDADIYTAIAVEPG
jgi:hypothetical protein